MSDFVNTVDLVGDEALTDSIINRSITELADSQIKSTGHYAFYNCKALTRVDLLVATDIGFHSFDSCSSLATFILRSSTGATLNFNALRGTKIASRTGYIYVPAALVDSYKAASEWSTYANQIRALEDYTVDGTVTGALDASKI